MLIDPGDALSFSCSAWLRDGKIDGPRGVLGGGARGSKAERGNGEWVGGKGRARGARDGGWAGDISSQSLPQGLGSPSCMEDQGQKKVSPGHGAGAKVGWLPSSPGQGCCPHRNLCQCPCWAELTPHGDGALPRQPLPQAGTAHQAIPLWPASSSATAHWSGVTSVLVPSPG